MNVGGKGGSKGQRPEDMEQMFEAMFRGVASRPRPPGDVERSAFESFSRDWETHRNRPARGRHWAYLAAAASVLLAVVSLVLFFRAGDTPPVSAPAWTVQRVIGTVELGGHEGAVRLAATSGPMSEVQGLPVSTLEDAGLLVRLSNGRAEVRVDQQTQLSFQGVSRIELDSGRIFVDVPPGAQAGDDNIPLEIITGLGRIRHLGTQFMVSAAGDQEVEVLLREGSVEIESGRESLIAQAGEKGTIESSGAVTSEPVPVYGPSWAWIEDLAPSYDLEGKTLEQFLDWVGRQTGKLIVFDSARAKQVATTAVLHGRPVELAPLDALDLVLQTSGLSWDEQGGSIHLFEQK